MTIESSTGIEVLLDYQYFTDKKLTTLKVVSFYHHQFTEFHFFMEISALSASMTNDAKQ